jgi:hypothetical protein
MSADRSTCQGQRPRCQQQLSEHATLSTATPTRNRHVVATALHIPVPPVFVTAADCEAPEYQQPQKIGCSAEVPGSGPAASPPCVGSAVISRGTTQPLPVLAISICSTQAHTQSTQHSLSHL